jgi:rhodanese-related sulfurtransferase
MKTRKSLLTVLSVLLIAAFVIAGCAPKAAPTAAPMATEAPTEVVTEAPTAAPTEAPFDIQPVLVEYLKAIPDGFGTIAPAALKDQMAAAPVFLLDVREEKEVTDNGFIEGAVNIPIRTVMKNLDKLPALDQPIVVYCGSGHRSAIVMTALQLLGYKNVKSLAGGLKAWVGAELPVLKEGMAAPVAGTKPVVDENVLAALDTFLSNIPDGFLGIAPAALNDQIAAAKPVLIDVREPKELTDNGYIADSVNIPLRTLLDDMSKLPADKTTPIVVYCGSGHRSAMALDVLSLLGYTNVKSELGGFKAWVAAELPIVKP